MWYTHAAFGALLGLFFFPAQAVVLAVIGSLLPDIDHEDAKIHKLLPTRRLTFLFTHRGFFHSLFPAALLYVVFTLIGFTWVGSALVVGYLSHLFLDGMTKMGIHLLYPFLHVRGFIDVGGMVEKALFVGLVVLIGLHLWVF